MLNAQEWQRYKDDIEIAKDVSRVLLDVKDATPVIRDPRRIKGLFITYKRDNHMRALIRAENGYVYEFKIRQREDLDDASLPYAIENFPYEKHASMLDWSVTCTEKSLQTYHGPDEIKRIIELVQSR